MILQQDLPKVWDTSCRGVNLEEWLGLCRIKDSQVEALTCLSYFVR